MAHRIDLPADPVVCRHCGKEFRAIMFLHLRRKHNYQGDHPVLEYKRRFGLPIAMCDESRAKIRTARNEFWEERGQHWTRKRVITAIKNRQRKDQSLRRNLVPAALHDAACRLFGNWRAAIEKAGLDYDHIRVLRQWSREKVLKYVQELATQGVPLNSKHIKEHYPFLYSSGIKKFPRSWSKVLRAAGFDPAEHKLPPDKWDKVSAEEWVREQLAQKESILARDAPSKLFEFVREQLKMSWVDYLESLGISDHGSHRVRHWDRKMVISEIRRLKADGRRLNYQAVAQADQSLMVQARKFFGSWDAARAAARV
jgi:hypothetical protein